MKSSAGSGMMSFRAAERERLLSSSGECFSAEAGRDLVKRPTNGLRHFEEGEDEEQQQQHNESEAQEVRTQVDGLPELHKHIQQLLSTRLSDLSFMLGVITTSVRRRIRVHLCRFAVPDGSCQAGQRHPGSPAEVLELHEELVVPDDVNQRVDGAVETRQAPAHLMRDVDVAEARVADSALLQNPGRKVEVSKHVVGDEANGEEDQQDQDQLQTPLLQQRVDVGFLGENRDDVPVTDQDDDQRHGEPRHGPADAVRHVALDQLVRRGVVTRVRGLRIVLVEEHVGQDLDDDKQPDQGADGQRVAAGDFAHHPHGVHDTQVPVDADAASAHAPDPPDVGQRPDDKHDDKDGRQEGVRKVQLDAHPAHGQRRIFWAAVDWRQLAMLQEQDSITITCCRVSRFWGQRKTIRSVLVWEGLQQRPSRQVRAQNLGR
ncbi:hypothetical protein EYF80_001468 [Liparis tanakae]|uniref:Uncharacterized protein n=1 Tax=Liparis tanakae TaxID=230148 RepID=A0A4Z2JG48_9TELE|nr:hypothetical protein EYF80_001468 [Liparis tanakae]